MTNNIKKYLDKRGLKSIWVAEQIGCHPSEFSNWVRGERRPNLPRAMKLANLLNCKVEDLFPEEQPEQQPEQ